MEDRLPGSRARIDDDTVIGEPLACSDIRDELVIFYTSLLKNCESMHIVIEGTEFQQSIKRSVIANMLLVVPARGRVFIENSLQGVIAAGDISPPTSLEARNAGLHELLDVATLKLPFVQNAVGTSRAYLRDHPEVVRRFEAVRRGLANQPGSAR